jgi:alcohol dehydrogenase class IV
VFLPHVLDANRDVIGRDVARLVGDTHGKDAGRDPVGWLASEAARLLSAYGLSPDLRGFGIPTGKLPELAEKSSGSSMRGNPRELSMESPELAPGKYVVRYRVLSTDGHIVEGNYEFFVDPK